VSEATAAEGLAEARARAYGDQAGRPAARPQMVAFDLANGMTANVARCCEEPRPDTGLAEYSKNTKTWHADVYCRRCDQTLAVIRWKLG